MKHRLSIIAVLLLAVAIPQSVKAYDFSAIAPSGQTLYYEINGDNVTVTYPGSSYSGDYDGYTMPTGNLEIPSFVTNNGTTYSVTSIGAYAFYACNDLASVSISNSVTSIGIYAFFGCISLTSVDIPNSITSISEGVFSDCEGLTTVTIPNSVITIDERAFSNCSGLTSVAIPNSVISIGNSVFSNCSGLTSVDIPNSVTSIGNSVFSDCSGLTSVAIPNSVTSIGGYAFSGCSGLTSVDIPNSITSISYAAFFVCSGLTSVTIPISITSIGGYAFYGCTGLTSVTIPNYVTSIDHDAFGACTGLSEITCLAITAPTLGNDVFDGVPTDIPVYVLCGSVADYQAAEGWNSFTNIQDIPSETVSEFDAVATTGQTLHYTINSDNTTVTLSGHEANFSGDLIIPATVNYNCNTYTVTKIGTEAFYTCEELTSVYIPNSVIEIGMSAFTYCRGISSLTIPSSVTSIGDGAFRACSGLAAIEVESGNNVYDSRENCNAIIVTATNKLIRGCSNTIIPNTVTSIGDGAFQHCWGLTEITIPEGVTTIGSWTFDGCTGLTSVTILGQITEIDSYAFRGCRNMISINLPNTLISIRNEAFTWCYSLSTITIPASVNFIGDWAFWAAFSSMTFLSEQPPYLDGNPFRGLSQDIPIYVPCGSVDNYQATNGWDYFSNFVEPESPYMLEVQGSTEAMGSVAVTTALTCSNNTAEVTATANPGYRFDHWSDGNTDNPRSLTVTQDTTLTAIFEADANTPAGGYSIRTCTGQTLLFAVDDNSHTATVTGYVAPCEGALIVPPYFEVDGVRYTVTAIGDGAFQNCTELVTVTLPASITTVGENAFTGSTALQDVKMW